MGLMNWLTGGSFFGSGRQEGEEHLTPGPMGTQQLPEARRSYGRLGGQKSLEDVHSRVETERAGEDGESSDEVSPIGHRLGTEGTAERLEQRASWPRHIFGEKTSRVFKKFRKSLSKIESAESPEERVSAERSFRWRMFRSERGIKAKLDKYAGHELQDLQEKERRELEHLEKKGADEREIKRTTERLSEKERKLRRDLDRRFYRPLRGIARRTGTGSGSGIKPPF